MSAERFTLDTNVLVYYVDTGAGPRHHRAIEIVERAAEQDCWLTLQSVSEFYAAVTRKGLVARERAAALANDWLEAFPSAAPSVSAMRAALVSAAAGRASWWDAVLVATAAEAGCTAILTEDLSDGGSLHGVRVLNPFEGRDIPADVRILLDGG
jgi:predicted nucleic acid-binding protein